MRPPLIPRSRTARLARVILAAAGLAIMAASPAQSAPGASAPAWRTSEVLSPAGGSYGVLYGITCSASATCVAGGSFYSASHGELPMIAVESAGKWGRGLALRLPPGANALDQDALVASIACPGARGPKRCVAVGYYDDPAGMQGFIAEGNGTRWGRASKVPLPPGAGATGTGALSGIRCTGAGTCIAAGGYETAAGADAGLILTQSHGRWRHAARVRPPGNAAKENSDAHLSAVSCEAAGECVAVGAYFTKSGASEGMAVAEAKGRWGTAVQTPLPGNAPKVPQAELYSVGCSPHRYCVAVGTYFTAKGNNEAVMAVMYERGRWRRPVDITALPANASTPNPGASLNAVSCAALACLAVGNYKDKQGGQAGMSVSESGGRWQRAVAVGLPAHAARRSAQQAYVFAVTCTRDWCAAGGQYTDTAGIPQAMAAHRLGAG
jgi:hypothetical protein